MEPESSIAVGPTSYRNWRAFLDGQPLYGRAEIPLYSNVEFSLPDSNNLGPYALQHAFPAELRDPAIILFVNGHLDPNALPRMDATQTEGFTGSSSGDEIAALLSLSLGRRFLAGEATRILPRGEQQKWIIVGDAEKPMFFRSNATRRLGPKRSVLPRADERTVVTTQLLGTLPQLSPENATTLVRAARSYRDALWIAETEPELAWLLFVSALEVAAVQVQAEVPATEILRLAKPKLVRRLEAIDSALVDELAKELSRELRATKRFLGFLERFMPPPPERRPPEGWGRLDWFPEPLRAALDKIYKYRSLALHECIPFPPPMCRPPEHHGDWDAPSEGAGGGLASATANGVWKQEDLPMSLHTFEYIARGALLGWWKGLANPAAVS